MRYDFYQICWMVLIYAFLGWCTEVAFAALKTGKFVNRGFLNGPVCPIYGFGVLSVVLVLEPIKENFMLLFLGSAVFCSLLEFIAGWLLEKVFNDKWWDYSGRLFNIKGYICLEFSIMWGLACIIVVDAIHPYIMRLIHLIPVRVGIWIAAALWALFVSDLIITLVELLKLPRRFKALGEVERALTALSDSFGEKVVFAGVEHGVERYKAIEEKHPEHIERAKERVQSIKDKGNELSEKAKEMEAEIRAKYEERERLLRRNIVHERIMRAYPNLLNGQHNGENFRKLRKSRDSKK